MLFRSQANAIGVGSQPGVHWGNARFTKANVRLLPGTKGDRLVSEGMQEGLAGVEDLQSVHASATGSRMGTKANRG